jgi:iron complex transport system substrate-binding protein
MHRLLIRLALATLLMGSVAACGSGSTSSSGGDGGEAPDGAFPVTIEHKFGSTTIESEPERIVTVGLTDQDAVLALGRVPVGTTDWLGHFDAAIGPWAEDELGDAELPTLLHDTGTGPQQEDIALLNPDIILAQYAGLTQEQYDSLSQIAPVVAQPDEYIDYGVPWQVQTTTIGRALGQEEEARRLVEDVEARYAAERSAHPEFEDATAVAGAPFEGFFVWGNQDPRSRVLTDLGFSLPPALEEVVGDEFGVDLSEERTDLLDQDVIVWTALDPEADRETLHANPLYGDLDVVDEGREIYIEEVSDYGDAYTFMTVLSIPYALDRLVPQLAAAVDGDPATAVEQE